MKENEWMHAPFMEIDPDLQKSVKLLVSCYMDQRDKDFEQMSVVAGLPKPSKQLVYWSNEYNTLLESNIHDWLQGLAAEQRSALDRAVWAAVNSGEVAAGLCIGEITDSSHPAKRAALGETDNRPVYGLFAAAELKALTTASVPLVLGIYSGRLLLTVQCEKYIADNPLEERDHLYSMDLEGLCIHETKPRTAGAQRWVWPHSKRLTVNALIMKNELCFINDFRQDTSGDKEPGPEEWSKANVILTTVIVDGLPYSIGVLIRNVPAGQEILFDYGQQYWDNCEMIQHRYEALQKMVNSSEETKNQLSNTSSENNRLRVRNAELERFTRTMNAGTRQLLRNKEEEVRNLRDMQSTAEGMLRTTTEGQRCDTSNPSGSLEQLNANSSKHTARKC